MRGSLVILMILGLSYQATPNYDIDSNSIVTDPISIPEHNPELTDLEEQKSIVDGQDTVDPELLIPESTGNSTQVEGNSDDTTIKNEKETLSENPIDTLPPTTVEAKQEAPELETSSPENNLEPSNNEPSNYSSEVIPESISSPEESNNNEILENFDQENIPNYEEVSEYHPPGVEINDIRSGSSISQHPSYDNNSANNTKSFSGLCYSMLANKGCKTQSQVQQDLQLINKYTNHIRLYGSDCEQLRIVLKMIINLKLDLKMLTGIWTRDGPGRRRNEVKTLIRLIKENPHHLNIITGVTVGNEELFNSRNINEVIQDMSEVRQQLQTEQINIPVSTVEVGHLWSQELAQHSDKVFANLYSFFGTRQEPQLNMNQAVQVVVDQYENLKSKLNTDDIIISETGWPSSGDVEGPHYGPPTISNQAQYINKLTCLNPKIPYYIMEAFDATWKSGDGIERNFGIFNQQGEFKDPALPTLTCS